MNRDFEKLLANHCAPLLCGKKPAVLLAERNFPQNCEWKLLRQYGFCMLRLRLREANTLIFLYHPALLKEAVSHPIAAKTLCQIGYVHEKGLSGLLGFLRRRFAQSHEFPHEIGLFLGYPPEDVVGFLSCKESCKMCGYWKVYSDVNRAVALFDEYTRCKQALQSHIKNGGSIFSVISPVLAG